MIGAFLDWHKNRLRRRRWRRWEDKWSAPAFDPKWAKRAPPPEMIEAVASGWLPPVGRVLDIGCGLGEISAWFAEHGYPSLGVDIAPTAIRKAESLYAHLPAPPRFLALDVCTAVPPGGPFDVLIDRGCLHGIPEVLVPEFMRNISAVSTANARMMLFMRAYRDARPFADEQETREHVEWVSSVTRGYFTIEHYAPTYLSSDGKFDPENPLPGLVYRLTRVPSTSS